MLKKILIILLILAGLLVVVMTGGIIYMNSAYPKVSPPKEMKINSTPEMVKRGEYLANHVTVCIDCHSTRDWSKFSGPIFPGTHGKGGDYFGENMGIPGMIYAANITPSGVSKYSDGELYHLITTGVKRNGEPMFPLMPYPSYKYMASEDVKSIIAYLRSLKPIDNKVPESKINFPLNLIMRMVPSDPEPMKIPDTTNLVAYGKYVVTIAGCGDCHTPLEKGQPVKGKEFAGGREFTEKSMGTVRSSNITPDKQTGIGLWSEDYFMSRFRTFTSEEAKNQKVPIGHFQTVMPWTMYAGMTDTDLKAVYAYLKSLQPISNKITKFTAPH